MKIAVSTAPLPKLEDEPPYGFRSTLRVMKRIVEKGGADSFELLYKPEWDGDLPMSKKDVAEFRAQDVLHMLQDEYLPISSVHARKDLGLYLCSDLNSDLKKGCSLIRDSLIFTEALEAEVCVFHLWDTFSTSLDIDTIRSRFSEIANEFPAVKASVENIPTNVQGISPCDLIRSFRYVTLDTRWATTYKELGSFEPMVNRIVNIHLRGELRGERWFLDNPGLDFYRILERIRKNWGYSGLLTVEPDGELGSSRFRGFLEAMIHLKRDEPMP